MANIYNIVFDLGGVLYQLDFPQFEQSLRQLQVAIAPNTPPVWYSRTAQPEIFSLYESGKINTPEFRTQLRQEFQIVAGDRQIDAAWNAILVKTFAGRVELLQKLKQNYRLALLSNINELHLNFILEQDGRIFSPFEHCFFSYQMRLRKPQPEIFAQVLQTMNFRAEETLFIDDSPQHVEAAQQIGIQGFWLPDPEILEQKLTELLK